MIIWTIINTLIFVLFTKVLKSPIVRVYLLVNFIIFVVPVYLYYFFGIQHPKFISGDISYTLALQYMSVFNIILCASYVLLLSSIPRVAQISSSLRYHSLNSPNQNFTSIVSIFMMIGVGFLAKLQLNSMGSIRMLEITSGGPYLQLLKVFGGFDILALILFGEIRNAGDKHAKRYGTLYFFAVTLCMLAALYSGSRGQVIIVGLIVLLSFRKKIWSHRTLMVPVLIAGLPTIFVIFPIIGYWRVSGYDVDDALFLFEKYGDTGIYIMLNILATRLNYLEPLGRVISLVNERGPAGGESYWNNIIGVVPRAIWPGKPQITNNSQDLGHELDLVSLTDESTSIGLRVLGESFYEYGWLGVWVAIFQALIFVLLHKNLYFPGKAVSMAVYTYMVIFLMTRDGYFAVIPGLIWGIIGIALFFFMQGIFKSGLNMVHRSR